MKRIIIEGMDSTGKSTLAEKLHSEFHYLVTVVNELGPEQNFEYWWPHILQKDYRPFVPMHDRFFYSELVYGYHLRGYVKAPVPLQDEVVQQLRKDALLIYARPSDNTMLDTFANKQQMEGVLPRAQRLLHAYDELMWREQVHYKGRFNYYNWERGDGGVISLVERYLSGDVQ